MRRGTRHGQCAYCGVFGPVSDDHIPPKGVFPTPRPSNLITVPACDAHHTNEQSRDDELFRFQLAIDPRAELSPSARKLWPSLIESVTKPRKRGWAGYVFRTVRKLPVHTQAGVYIGEFPTYELNIPRLHRVADRIIRGLYFTHLREPVPGTHAVKVFAAPLVRRLPDNVRQSFAPLIAFVQRQPPVVIGDRVFRYHFRSDPVDASSCVVSLIFYEAFAFVGWVMPRRISPGHGQTSSAIPARQERSSKSSAAGATAAVKSSGDSPRTSC